MPRPAISSTIPAITKSFLNTNLELKCEFPFGGGSEEDFCAAGARLRLRFVNDCKVLVSGLRQSAGVPCPFFNISPVPNESRFESCHRSGEVGMSLSNGMNRLCMAEAKALGDLVSSH